MSVAGYIAEPFDIKKIADWVKACLGTPTKPRPRTTFHVVASEYTTGQKGVVMLRCWGYATEVSSKYFEFPKELFSLIESTKLAGDRKDLLLIFLIEAGALPESYKKFIKVKRHYAKLISEIKRLAEKYKVR